MLFEYHNNTVMGSLLLNILDRNIFLDTLINWQSLGAENAENETQLCELPGTTNIGHHNFIGQLAIPTSPHSSIILTKPTQLITHVSDKINTLYFT